MRNVRKSTSESGEMLLSVDVIQKSGPLKLIGQFGRDVIGCKSQQ